MELTQEQVQYVEKYLDRKQLNYIDIRFEVLDHIVTDIENLMTEKEKTFENAFNITKLKWDKYLNSSCSFFTGLVHQRPRLVIDKSRKTAKRILVSNLLCFILIPFLFSLFNIPDIIFENESLAPLIFRSIAIVTSVLILFWYVMMLKQNKKTTYLFLYEKQIVGYVIFGLILCFDLYGSDKVFLKSPYFGYSLILIVMSFFGYKLYKSHNKTVKKYDFY